MSDLQLVNYRFSIGQISDHWKTVTNNAGRKIYSIELLEIKKAEGKLQGKVKKLHKASSTFDILNISKITNIVNNSSKAVDENGEPLIVYHGTEAEFNTFDRTKTRANMDIQGNFFSPYRIEAAGYGFQYGKFLTIGKQKPS